MSDEDQGPIQSLHLVQPSTCLGPVTLGGSGGMCHLSRYDLFHHGAPLLPPEASAVNSAENCLDELFKLTPDLDLLNRIKSSALMGDAETLDEYAELFNEHVVSIL